jgi:type IV pilus assembly protein PilM
MRTPSIFNFFPTPKFLEMPYVGFQVSDDAARFVEIVKGKKGLEVGRYASMPIPKGVIEGGYVNDPSALIKLLKAMREKHGLSFVKASLPEEKAYLFKAELELTDPDDAEIREAIEFKLEENVPISALNAIFDYSVISSAPGRVEVSISVLPSKVVETYLDIFHAAGLTPLAFETEGRAVARTMAKSGTPEATIVVDFREAQTGLYIVSNGSVRFTSTLTVGGGMLSEALMKNFGITKEEAERMKREKGMDADGENSEMWGYFTNALSVLKDELAKVIAYWQSREENAGKPERKIGRIVLCGADAALAGFDRYVALNTKIPAELGNVWGNVRPLDSYIPPIEFVDSLDYAVAIGLALPDGK